MRKFKEKLKKLTALSLATAVLVTTIDTSAFADELKAVNYAGVGYDTIAEAINAAEEAGDTTPDVQVQKSMTFTETMYIKTGWEVSINAPEGAIMTVEKDSTVIEIADDAALNINGLHILGNDYEGTETTVESYSSSIVINNGILRLNNAQIGEFCLSVPGMKMTDATLEMQGTSKLYKFNSTQNGGAVLCDGICRISGGVFEENEAANGAAIGGADEDTKVIISNAQFNNNYATTNGGSIYVKNVAVNECTFNNSVAYGKGGAVYCNGRCEIYNSTFISGGSSGSDGLIYLDKSESILAGIEITSSYVSGKGVIRVEGGNATIKSGTCEGTDFESIVAGNNIIQECSATDGGALYITTQGVVIIEQAEFIKNNANSGGAIYNKGTLELYEVVLNENKAHYSNTNNSNTVSLGDGIFNEGTLKLYEKVVLNDQIYLQQGKTVTVKQPLLYHGSSEKIKVAVRERITDTFRAIATYDLIPKEGEEGSNSEAQAYDDSLKEMWNLQSVDDEKNQYIGANGNLVGLFSNIYEKELVCIDDSGKGVKGVVFELFIEKNSGYCSLGNISQTDVNGEVKIAKLQEGKYFVKLKSIPEGYTKIQTMHEFSVGEEVENEKLTISLGAYNEAPVAQITTDVTIAKAGETIVFSAKESTDDDEIVSYEWKMGDGRTKSGEEVSHFYLNEGDYVVILTVTDSGGRTSTKSVSVHIEGVSDLFSKVVINVKDSNDEAITYPYLCIMDENDEVLMQGQGDDKGTCTVMLRNNKNYGISAMASGYYTRSTNLYMEDEEKEITLYLPDSKTVVGELTSKEMTLEEIKEAGIDTENEDNYRVVKHSLKLVFVEVKEYGEGETYKTVNFFTNAANEVVGNQTVVDKSNSDIKVTACAGGRSIYFLVIDGTTKWLKDFFNVQLIVYNNSTVENIQNCKATLNLPEGLSLAAMNEGADNNIEKDVGTILPNESAVTQWYVRGDADGDYQISAKLKGELYSEDSEVEEYEFEHDIYCNDLLSVRAGNALFLNLEFNNRTETGEIYSVHYTYTNVSEKPIYGLKFSFDREIQYANDGAIFHYGAGDTHTCDELSPGESITITHSTVIKFLNSDNLPFVAELVGHAFSILGGSNASMPYAVNIVNTPLSEFKHLGYGPDTIKIFAGDPVNMLTGTFEYNYTDYTIGGRHELAFERYYSSARNEDRGLGIGFRHSYDYYLEKEENYIRISYPNGSGVTFEIMENGEYVENTGRKLENYNSGYLFTDTGREYVFDTNGNLLSICEKDGWETTISRDSGGNIVSIKSRAGEMLLTWADSKIISVTASGVHNTYTYENDRLIGVVNPDNDIMSYSYDENGHLSEVADFRGNTYIKNVYDSEGRVTYQNS